MLWMKLFCGLCEIIGANCEAAVAAMVGGGFGVIEIEIFVLFDLIVFLILH